MRRERITVGRPGGVERLAGSVVDAFARLQLDAAHREPSLPGATPEVADSGTVGRWRQEKRREPLVAEERPGAFARADRGERRGDRSGCIGLLGRVDYRIAGPGVRGIAKRARFEIRVLGEPDDTVPSRVGDVEVAVAAGKDDRSRLERRFAGFEDGDRFNGRAAAGEQTEGDDRKQCASHMSKKVTILVGKANHEHARRRGRAGGPGSASLGRRLRPGSSRDAGIDEGRDGDERSCGPAEHPRRLVLGRAG